MSSQPHQPSRNRPLAVISLEDSDGFRCVDIIEHPDGTFTFKEFRRDPEDAGRWTLVDDYSHERYATKDDALRAAAGAIPWFAERREGDSE